MTFVDMLVLKFVIRPFYRRNNRDCPEDGSTNIARHRIKKYYLTNNRQQIPRTGMMKMATLKLICDGVLKIKLMYKFINCFRFETNYSIVHIQFQAK